MPSARVGATTETPYGSRHAHLIGRTALGAGRTGPRLPGPGRAAQTVAAGRTVVAGRTVGWPKPSSPAGRSARLGRANQPGGPATCAHAHVFGPWDPRDCDKGPIGPTLGAGTMPPHGDRDAPGSRDPDPLRRQRNRATR